MKKFVGSYELGLRTVRLYVGLDTANGHVILTPTDRGATEIMIGIDCPYYESVGTLLHEAYECTMIDLNTRFKPQPSFSCESSDFIFILTHNQLSEAHERVGTFISEVYQAFNKAYETHSPEIKRKKKSKR